MTIFEHVVEYVSQFDPKFPEMIVPARPEQIAELEFLLDGPVPDIYRDFLQVMGRGMDWITIRKMDLRIETVLDYYRRENWLPRNQFIRIGTEHEEPRLHPHLQIELPDQEPEVVCFPACRREDFDEIISSSLDPLAGSLQEMIAMPVFKMFELGAQARVLACLRASHWDGEALNTVEQISLSLGFEKLWFSSHTGHAYRHQGAAIHANQHLGYPLQIFVSASNKSDVEQVVTELSQGLPALKRVS